MESLDWLRYYYGFLATFGLLFEWLGAAIGVYVVILFLVILWRFLRVKFGKKIKPNGNLAILITGATSGFGLALAKVYYKLGFSVIATYYNDQEVGYTELKELSGEPIKSDARSNFRRPYLFLSRMDVKLEESIEACRREVETLLDHHDIKLYSLINNAGICALLPFHLCANETITDLIDTNLKGLMLVTRKFLSHIIENKGKVINVSSGTHQYPGAQTTIYGATKRAVYYFSLALHDSIKKYGASSHCMVLGNFVCASNIVYANLKHLAASNKSLTYEERNLYEDSLIDCEKRMRNLLTDKLNNSGDKLTDVAAIYNFTMPDSRVDPGDERKPRTKSRLDPQAILSGKSSTLDSGLEAFKQVICLQRPSLIFYPGTPFYSYIVGPMMGLTPDILNNFNGPKIIDNLAPL